MCVEAHKAKLEHFQRRLKHYERVQVRHNCNNHYRKRMKTDDSESEVDSMGNNSSKRPPLPNVYYNRRNSGITVGSRPSSPGCHNDHDDENCSSNEDLKAASASSSMKPENVRLRPRSMASRHKSPSPSSDKDSAIGGAGGSEMSQSLYSENSLNRDSFYSTGTAESGFDDLGFLEELRSSKLTGSMKENFSPNSLHERSLQMLYRHHRGRDPGLNTISSNGLETLSDCDSTHSGILSSCSTRSSCSSEGTYVMRTNVDPLEQKMSGGGGGGGGHKRHISSGDKPGIAFSTPASDKSRQQQQKQIRDSAVNNSFTRQSSSSYSSSSKSSPYYHPTPVGAGGRPSKSTKTNHGRLRYQTDEVPNQQQSPHRQSSGAYPGQEYNYGGGDEDVTESIHSFNSSGEFDINWQEGEEMMENQVEKFNGLSLPDQLNTSLSDLNFRQNLMQRIQEWSTFAEEYNKSLSPTPESSPIRFVRRSRSLDRHLSDCSILATEAEIPSSKPLMEIEPVTEKNLETLEYELHDIQGEFESITSKLHDLIEQQHQPQPPLAQASMSSSYPAASSSSSSKKSTSSPPLPLSSIHNNNNNNNVNNDNNGNSYPNRTMPLCRDRKDSSSSSPHYQRHNIESNSNSLSTPCVNNVTTSSESNSSNNRHSSLRKMKTKWERVPGSACSDCSRSSRASSVEYVWDLADYSLNLPPSSAERSRSEDGSRSSPRTGRRVSQGGRLLSTDLCPVDASECVCNINNPVSVLEHCQREWKGDTPKAEAIRQGYHQIPSSIQCHRMCVVRGDNYCALRSTLFQVLVNGLRIVPSSWGIIGIMDRLHNHFEDPTINMSSWTFANRLPGHGKDKLASISKCALSLYATVEEICSLPSREEREKRTINLFNASSTFDLELMEGVKVMMLLQLVSLRQSMLDGGEQEDIPMFAHLLFARDTSESVSDFIKNHLNCVGDTGGLEQVEMCLLGYTLGVSIRVLRLSQTGQEDCQCCFPDDMPPDTPQVVLIAEDERHYNVPLP